MIEEHPWLDRKQYPFASNYLELAYANDSPASLPTARSTRSKVWATSLPRRWATPSLRPSTALCRAESARRWPVH